MLMEYFYCSVATSSVSVVGVNKHEVQENKRKKRVLGGTIVGSKPVRGL